MTRQKRDLHAIQFTHDKRIRRLAERRVDGDLPDIFEFRHLVEAAAADDADVYLFHNKIKTGWT